MSPPSKTDFQTIFEHFIVLLSVYLLNSFLVRIFPRATDIEVNKTIRQSKPTNKNTIFHRSHTLVEEKKRKF